jgi:hypothetical protein
VSLNEIVKQSQIAGKGHNEIFVIFNFMEHMTASTDVAVGHVPENGGTCALTSQRRFQFPDFEHETVAQICHSANAGNIMAICLFNLDL